MVGLDPVDQFREAISQALLVASPVLLAALSVGVLTGLLQAASQIQDQSLSAIPKLLAVGAVLVFCGPWMVEQLAEYAREMVERIPSVVMRGS